MVAAGTAVEAEASTEAVAAADFMGAAAGSMAEEDSPAGTLDLMAATRMAGVDFMAAIMVAAVLMVDTGMDGAAEAGVVEDGAVEVGVVAGAGDMVGAGRIGDTVGVIPMATTAIRITRPTIIRTRLTEIPTVIQRTT
jgi:hypothetical protein